MSATPSAIPDRRSGQRVVTLALIGWGLGHVALGLRRGWLLLAAEVVALLLLIGIGLPRIEGDAVDGIFLAVVLFFVIWVAQVIDAYRRAAHVGAPPGSAIGVLALLPVAVLVFSAFWMVGGAAATASATLDRYVDAWRHGRPDAADHLLLVPMGPAAMTARWTAADAVIGSRLKALAGSLGPGSGFDAQRPFTNLEFRLQPSTGAADARVSIVVVRHVSIRSSFLGLVPTAVQQTEVLDQIGTIDLTAVPLMPSGGLGDWPATQAWRVVGLVLEP
ncbi:MAG: hypothetical protein ACRDF7_03110 [Candidatus Limnocylindrales bacterium]